MKTNGLIYKLISLTIFFSFPALANKDCGYGLQNGDDQYCTDDNETNSKILKCYQNEYMTFAKENAKELVSQGEFDSEQDIPDSFLVPPGVREILVEKCYEIFVKK